MSLAAIVLAEGRASWSQKYACRCHFFLEFGLGKLLGIWSTLKMNCVITESHSKILGFYSPEPARLSFV